MSTRPRPDTDWVELCCAVSASPDHANDCLCLLDRHPDDEPHECATQSCRRQWTSTPVGRAA